MRSANVSMNQNKKAGFAAVAAALAGVALLTAGCGGADDAYSPTVDRPSPSPSPSASTIPDFTLSPADASRTVVAGEQVTFAFTVTAINGWDTPLELTASGLPEGATATFSPNPVTPTAAGAAVTLTVRTAAGSPAVTRTPVIQARPVSGPAAPKQAPVTVAITDATGTISPAAQTLNTGETVAYVVTLTPVNGYTGRVSLTAEGLPASVTRAFSNDAAVTFAAGETAPRTVTLTLGLPGSIGTDRPTFPFAVVAAPEGTSRTLRLPASVTLNSTGSVGGVID